MLSDKEWKDLIIGGDIAVQLRKQGNGKFIIGQLSSSVTACLGSGLVVLANNTLAQSFDSNEKLIDIGVVNPKTISDTLFEAVNKKYSRDDDIRRNYITKDTFNQYAQKLKKLLEKP
jgi:hypothetical protein